MAEKTQSYSNHKRFLPIFHFFVVPILVIQVVAVGRTAFHHPTAGNWWQVILWIAVLIASFTARSMALTAQDRVIRFEEKSRLGGVLPAEMRGNASGLTRGQYVALRFAPDEEVPELVRRIHSGELKSAGDIKAAIKNWRADHFRV